MAKEPYAEVPWKRNLAKAPDSVRKSLAKIEGNLILVAATKLVSQADAAAGTYKHLFDQLPTDGIVSTLPSPRMGKYAERNVSGWDVPRKDLPKITNYTRFWETPNFGDGGRYGYHTHYATQQVWQREYFDAPRAEIESEVIKANEASSLVRFAVDLVIDRSSDRFEELLLFNLNLLQENTGVVNVFASGATAEDYAKSVALDWAVFPPGTAKELIEAFKVRRPNVTPDEQKVITERVMLFDRLKPRAYLQGTGAFGTYFGAQFADDLVVFENLKYGNAMYVLYDRWEDVSKRSRMELIRGTDANFDRITHTKGWKDAFQKIMRLQLKKRAK